MIRIPTKRIADALIWLLAVTLLLWLGDWTVWRIRVWRGGGYDTVQVNQILLIPLKNHKMEADAQNTADQPCARSIFPHGGDDPCWWLRRHATVWQQASLIVPVHSSEVQPKGLPQVPVSRDGCSQIAAAPNVSDQRNKPPHPMWTRAEGAIARTASPDGVNFPSTRAVTKNRDGYYTVVDGSRLPPSMPDLRRRTVAASAGSGRRHAG